MTKNIYLSVRVLVVVLSFLVLHWLYFNEPTIQVSGEEGDFKCNSVGWRQKGQVYSLTGGFDGRKEGGQASRFVDNNSIGDLTHSDIENNLEKGCTLARDDRRTMITVVSALSVAVFLSIPKPKDSDVSGRPGGASRRSGAAGRHSGTSRGGGTGAGSGADRRDSEGE